VAYLTQAGILSEKWSWWQYYGPTSDIHFCGRVLQSPTPSASGDASYNLFFRVEESAFSAKLPFFRRICATDGKIFRGVFSESGLK